MTPIIVHKSVIMFKATMK